MNLRTTLIALLWALALTPFPAQAADGWLMHGQGIENQANGKTDINVNNIGKLQLKSIYNIDTTTAGGKTRGENAVGSGIALTDGGIAYVPTTDGRIHVLDTRQIEGINPDGTGIPKVLNVFDLVADPRYTGASDADGDDIVVNRIHPTLAGKNIYAANYNLFLAFDAGGFSNDLLGLPMLTNGLAFQSQGAVLLSINKDTGDLNWKTVIDDNPHSMVTNNPTVHQGVVYAALSTEMSGSLGLAPFTFTSNAFGIVNPGVDPFLGLDPLGFPLPTDKSGLMYRNAMVALDEKTGEILWKSYVLPEQTYRSYFDIIADDAIDIWMGASSWGGGNFPIDTKRNLIYLSTGEAYTSPLEADACEQARLASPGADPFGEGCVDIDQDGNPITGPIQSVAGSTPGELSSTHPLIDAVVAMDLDTGEIQWANRLQGFDVWNFGCLVPVFGPAFPGDNFVPACPPYLRGPNFSLNFTAKDLDIAEMPMLVRNVKMPDGDKRDLLVVTSKAANVWALDPDNGEIVWAAPGVFGPGSLFGGGILWGSATDGERIYTTSTTSDLNVADLNDPARAVVPGSCPPEAFDAAGNLNGGVYGAIDLATGAIAWQRCLTGAIVDSNTGEAILDGNGEEILLAGFNEGPVSVAGGVVYVPGPTRAYGFTAPDVDLRAQVIALDGKTGALLKRLPFNAPGEPGATRLRFTRTAIAGDRVIIGNGFKDDFTSPLARRVVVYELE